MTIFHDGKKGKLWLSQEKYIDMVLSHFNKDKTKPTSTPLASHFMMSLKKSHTCEKEKEEIDMVPYSSIIGSLMYSMVCIRPNITHIIGVATGYFSNSRQKTLE